MDERNLLQQLFKIPIRIERLDELEELHYRKLITCLGSDLFV